MAEINSVTDLSNEGDVAVKWQSQHFVKGQSGDTYVPFTVTVDKAQLSKGAALYVRIVSAEQASAFGTAMAAMVVPPAQGAKPAAAPARPTSAGPPPPTTPV